jgi:hypothetical protein
VKLSGDEQRLSEHRGFPAFFSAANVGRSHREAARVHLGWAPAPSSLGLPLEPRWQHVAIAGRFVPEGGKSNGDKQCAIGNSV